MVFFSLFSPYSNQSPTKKSVFLYSCPNPYKAMPEKVFTFIFAFF